MISNYIYTHAAPVRLCVVNKLQIISTSAMKGKERKGKERKRNEKEEEQTIIKSKHATKKTIQNTLLKNTKPMKINPNVKACTKA